VYRNDDALEEYSALRAFRWAKAGKSPGGPGTRLGTFGINTGAGEVYDRRLDTTYDVQRQQHHTTYIIDQLLVIVICKTRTL
jgi:hypothetical protein